ncbi:MAG: exodeoxyribonuclease V subunit beta [Mycobacteriaceae bacterium]|nr:exodeoxyribonuclease V subunit beta [Mycobacteriaceae bacterium]
MDRFDLLGPLPSIGSRTMLEASAGTGKTFALAGLVTRYIAEGIASLDQMLLITFSRAATRELRERVRDQIAEAAAALQNSLHYDNELITYLRCATAQERAQRCHRLRDALASFDAATIATTHQFCHVVLKSLGVAGDNDPRAELTESLDELIQQIVDDLYLIHFSQVRDDAAASLLGYHEALTLARKVLDDPCAQLRPHEPPADSLATVRLQFVTEVRNEFELRKLRLGILSYDDLLQSLAKSLDQQDSPARKRMQQRWPIVLVDEFQDTDPLQWQIIDRAFNINCTLILIGDPKQAIYAFRGGDIVTYLKAARCADQRYTLGVNWRSDQVLVQSLQTVLRGAELGDADIVVHDVHAHHQGHRLRNAPRNQPFRLRVVNRSAFGRTGTQTIPIEALRTHISADLAADIGALLASNATFKGAPLQAGDIAVIVERDKDAQSCLIALAQSGIPAIYTSDTNVFSSEAAEHWLRLLTAFDQTQRSGLVRAAATTVFFGMTADDLAAGDDTLTDQVAETLRIWAGYLRERGPAAVYEAALVTALGRRVLSAQGGERMMTDLAHVAQLLQERAHRDRLSLPGLRNWLRRQRDEPEGNRERNRRLDSDAAAVQIMTVWGSKGLQFPIVYLPFAFNRHVFFDDVPLFHDDAGVRCLHVGGPGSPGRVDVERLSTAEKARNDIRLTYVALTRAQSQVVAWWAPAHDEPNGGLSRLLRGRHPGQAGVPDRCVPKVSDEQAMTQFREWAAVGGPVIEESLLRTAPAIARHQAPTDLAVRHFHRNIDTGWRRTSYSALIRTAGEDEVSSETDVAVRDDEVAEVALESAPARDTDLVSPMALLPAGAAFGSLVHAVLETADPAAPDLAGELTTQVHRHAPWWPVQIEAAILASAMVPLHDTPLGPLAAGLTLRQIRLSDRLPELTFELPLAGGDAAGRTADNTGELRLSDLGALLGAYLDPDDPLAAYVNRLTATGLGEQPLRGYLTGSIDVVLRLPGERYVVVDYKTNMLGETAAAYRVDRLREMMLHSDYLLQALLYLIALHRFLRWRRPGYDPTCHLGGVLYLFVRGMCGPQTPVHDEHPSGVYSWMPPTDLVVALSDLLDEGPAQRVH